jgi:hypothetical protein
MRLFLSDIWLHFDNCVCWPKVQASQIAIRSGLISDSPTVSSIADELEDSAGQTPSQTYIGVSNCDDRQEVQQRRRTREIVGPERH